MSIDQAAVAAEPDCLLAGLALVTVPEHWAPADAAGRAVLEQERTGPGGGAAGSQPSARERTWAQQFAMLLVEALAGVRPARQILPWLSKRGSAQLHRLMPLFSSGHRPRVVRVLTSMPGHDVIEMTLVVHTGTRVRALAVRLERPAAPEAAPQSAPGQASSQRPAGAGAPAARWTCTDIEAG